MQVASCRCPYVPFSRCLPQAQLNSDELPSAYRQGFHALHDKRFWLEGCAPQSRLSLVGSDAPADEEADRWTQGWLGAQFLSFWTWKAQLRDIRVPSLAASTCATCRAGLPMKLRGSGGHGVVAAYELLEEEREAVVLRWIAGRSVPSHPFVLLADRVMHALSRHGPWEEARTSNMCVYCMIGI